MDSQCLIDGLFYRQVVLATSSKWETRARRHRHDADFSPRIRLQAVEAGASISLTVHTSNSAPVMIASTGVPSDVPSGVMTHSFKIAPGSKPGLDAKVAPTNA